MFTAFVIGNLGADAVVQHVNGNEFVSFNVAHHEDWTDANGVRHDSTVWVSCSLNGNGGKLLQYLTKGRQVFVSGRASLRVFSSQIERQMKAGCNLRVDRIELLGGGEDKKDYSSTTKNQLQDDVDEKPGQQGKLSRSGESQYDNLPF